MGVVGCNDFLTGGELGTDPNNPPEATNSQLFVGAQASLWTLTLADPARYGAVFVQQYTGGGLGYLAIEEYDLDESTTNSTFTGIYTGGGLVNPATAGKTRRRGRSISQAQASRRCSSDRRRLFGDIVYSKVSGTRTGAREH